MAKEKTVIGYKQGEKIPKSAVYLYNEWQEESRVLKSDYYSNPSRRTYEVSEIKMNYFEVEIEVKNNEIF